MNGTQPYHGHFDGPHHLFAVRVYFEDTDFSGVVYHSRYLHFMERARSDMLSVAGIGQREAFDGGEGVYAVADLHIKYRAPARFDDALLVVSTVEEIRGASVVIVLTQKNMPRPALSHFWENSSMRSRSRVKTLRSPTLSPSLAFGSEQI